MSIIRVITNHLEIDNSIQINSASDNTSYYDPNYVDGYIFASTKNNSTRYHIRNLEYSGNSIWFHFRIHASQTAATTLSADTWVMFLDKYDRVIASVGKVDSGSNSVRLRVHGTSIITGVSSYSIPTGFSLIDIHYEQVGITANLSLYINGVLQETLTNTDIGNLQKCIHISGNPDAYAYSSTNKSKGRLSELIIADEDTRGLRVAKLKQSAPGTYNDFTGDVADLDTYTKEDFLNTDTVGQKVSWEPTAYLGAAGNVKYVGVSSMAQHHAGSPNSLCHFLRMGGVDYEGADIRTKFDGIIQQFWATNPETSDPWVTADLADIDEVGAKAAP